MAPKELEIAGLLDSSALAAPLGEKPRKRVRSGIAAPPQALKNRNSPQDTQEHRKSFVGEISSEKTKGKLSSRGVSDDSKSKIDLCLTESDQPTDIKYKQESRAIEHIPIRKLPPEQRRAYLAQKKRESDQRILSTEEGKKRRSEAMKPIRRKYSKKRYQEIKSDSVLHEKLKDRTAKNQRDRRARLAPERPSSSRHSEKSLSPV